MLERPDDYITVRWRACGLAECELVGSMSALCHGALLAADIDSALLLRLEYIGAFGGGV